MAENVQLMTHNAKYFCHICNREVSILHSTELICPNCSSDFLEEVSENFFRDYQDDEDISDPENDEIGLVSISRLGTLFNRLSTLADDSEYEDEEAEDQDEAPEEVPESPVDHDVMPEGVIQHLALENFEDLHHHYRDLHSFLSVFLDEDLDAISTMLLNEPDSSGPPPLPKEHIKLLPTISVSKEMIDNKVQCTVCMEDFDLKEKVKALPCEHCFHEKCITPWLEMHATCPNCRVLIETPELKNQRSCSWPRTGSSSSSQEPRSYAEATSSLTDFFGPSTGSFRFL